jgi:hypothetical protein
MTAFICGFLTATISAVAAPQAEKISDHVYRIGHVIVDTKARTATCEGRVNMRKGVIEYLAVPADGKRHESVLVLDGSPVHLQVALLLLDLEPKGGLRYQGDPQTPQGAAVEVRAEWRAKDGRKRAVRLEEFAWDIPGRRPMEAHPWIFTGARTKDPALMSFIATYRDPDAILNNPLATGSDDTVYKANERLVPPVGTRVTLVFRAIDQRPRGRRTDTTREAPSSRLQAPSSQPLGAWSLELGAGAKRP